MSNVARTVVDRTERVTAYPALDGGTYEIILSGKQLTLSSAQMARKTPDGDGAFNHLWLNLFPTEAIDATKNDWKEIRDGDHTRRRDDSARAIPGGPRVRRRSVHAGVAGQIRP